MSLSIKDRPRIQTLLRWPYRFSQFVDDVNTMRDYWRQPRYTAYEIRAELEAIDRELAALEDEAPYLGRS